MLKKQPKQKKCRNCKTDFKPFYGTTQAVCSFTCAAQLASVQQAKKAEKLQKEQKLQSKKELRTNPEWLNLLQTEINTIIRLIDAGWVCMSSQTVIRKGQLNAGHLYGRGSTPAIRFHLFNIFAQCVEQNKDKGGAPLEYLEGLKITFGEEVKETCYQLKYKHPVLKLKNHEIEEKITIAKSIIKWLKLQDRQFTLKERLELRQQFNDQLGIY